MIWLQRMFLHPQNNKIKTRKVANRLKVGKGNETLMDIADDEVAKKNKQTTKEETKLNK